MLLSHLWQMVYYLVSLMQRQNFLKEILEIICPQYQSEGYQKANCLLTLLNKMAKEKNCTMAQLSLAWMINKKSFIIPIPGSRKEARLLENFESCHIILTEDEIQCIDTQLKETDFEVFGGH